MTLMIAMTLHEQARVLRTLASVADHPIIRLDLLNLAKKCDELAGAALTSGLPVKLLGKEPDSLCKTAKLEGERFTGVGFDRMPSTPVRGPQGIDRNGIQRLISNVESSKARW